MYMCDKCTAMGGVLLLAVGILFLLQDLGIWSFWNLSWYTVGFILVGLFHIGTCCCKECREIRKK